MLTLPIKKNWFDMIRTGEKKEEYREIKQYYKARFATLGVEDNSKHYILFRNGYSKKSPTIKCKVGITIGFGKEEWGAKTNEEYFVLKILSVEEVK